VGDVVAVELAPPLVRGVLDGLPVHPTSVEQMFALWKGVVVEDARVSCRPRGRSPVAWLRDDAAPLLTGAVARAGQHPRPGGPGGVASNGPTSRGRVSVTSAGNDGARRGRATGGTNRGVGAGAIRGSRANDLDKRSKGICWSRDPLSLSLPNSSLSGQIMPTAISCKAITAEKSRVSLRTDRQAA
jgi:hypothetical protein